ncbi:MAG: hypothetical protein H6Q10_3270 [Acidobacteria bacterium]|jgi:hypothetical protein|nr:hypothetical protein [Acidobacteriota bacterium]
MPGKYDAYILEINGRFLVSPPVAALEGGQGKHFAVRNLTDFDATVKLDDAVNRASKTAAARGGTARFAVHQGADGDYPYVVWLHLGETDLRVNGNSDPVIIIDPPAS